MPNKWAEFILMMFHSLHELSVASRVCQLRRDLVEAKRVTNLFSAAGIQNHMKTHFHHIQRQRTKSQSFKEIDLAFLVALELRVEQQKSFYQYYKQPSQFDIAVKEILTSQLTEDSQSILFFKKSVEIKTHAQTVVTRRSFPSRMPE